MVHKRPETSHWAKATELLGSRWSDKIIESWEVDEDCEARFNLYAQYYSEDAGPSPYRNQVWGSQVTEYRYVRFAVSGPGIEEPRVRMADRLGEEWTALIKEYWVLRQERIKRQKWLKYLELEGYGEDANAEDKGVSFPGSSTMSSPDYEPSRSPDSQPLLQAAFNNPQVVDEMCRVA